MHYSKITKGLTILFFLFSAAACKKSGPQQEIIPLAKPPVASSSDLTLFQDVKPVFDKHCMSCHFNDVKAPKVNWTDFKSASAYVSNGKLKAYIGGGRMPPASAKKDYSDSDKDLILSWIASGGLETKPVEGEVPDEVEDQVDADTIIIDEDIARFQLTQQCAGCHGSYGMSFGGVPHLAGLSKDYLLTQLQSFSGKYEDVAQRTDSETMIDMVREIKDEDLEFLAEYFGSLRFNPEKIELDELDEDDKALYARGETLVEDNGCLGCHSPSAVPGFFPKILGQDQTYIETSLYAFSEGTREDETMKDVLVDGEISEDDFEAISLFLSRQTEFEEY